MSATKKKTVSGAPIVAVTDDKLASGRAQATERNRLAEKHIASDRRREVVEHLRVAADLARLLGEQSASHVIDALRVAFDSGAPGVIDGKGDASRARTWATKALDSAKYMREPLTLRECIAGALRLPWKKESAARHTRVMLGMLTRAGFPDLAKARTESYGALEKRAIGRVRNGRAFTSTACVSAVLQACGMNTRRAEDYVSDAKTDVENADRHVVAARESLPAADKAAFNSARETADAYQRELDALTPFERSTRASTTR